MARAVFENLTPAQAKELVNWYEGQGEQDAGIWFEINEVPVPYIDVHKDYETLEDGSVIAQCITYD